MLDGAVWFQSHLSFVVLLGFRPGAGSQGVGKNGR